jgi:lipid II:glycine glycyltransferase (peptidoglycan interpeptide bridge formation enzyme)
MIFREIKHKEQWDEKISSVKISQFLQSWNWGALQRSLGRKVWYLDLNGDYFLVIKMPLPFEKSYLYIPRTSLKINQKHLEFLIELAQNEKCIFVRIEPVKQNLEQFNFKKVKTVQPAKTLILDLQQSEDDLLKAMHQKTRYNIRLATKKGVVVKEGALADLDIFYDLISKTYSRKNIKVYNKEYYKKLLINLKTAGLYLAEYNGQVICANLVVFYGNTATYLHGGSSVEYKNVMAPHLLQWQTIKKAKQLGLQYYDFWGIEDRYPGVSRFKKGFGGFEIEYPGTFDFVINNFWYLTYQTVKRFK